MEILKYHCVQYGAGGAGCTPSGCGIKCLDNDHAHKAIMTLIEQLENADYPCDIEAGSNTHRLIITKLRLAKELEEAARRVCKNVNEDTVGDLAQVLRRWRKS